MSLSRMHIPLAALSVLLCLLIAFASWWGSQPGQDNGTEWGRKVFTASTPTRTFAPESGWWTAMPTDPSLPTMPPIALATVTATRTPSAATMTAVALTGTATTTSLPNER